MTTLFRRLSYVVVPAATFLVVLTAMRLQQATAELSDTFSFADTKSVSPISQGIAGGMIPVEHSVTNAVSYVYPEASAPLMVPRETASATSLLPIEPQSLHVENALGTNNLLRDPRFANEPVDVNWASPMEAMLTSLVHAIAADVQEVKEAECRTAICGVVVLHTDARQAMDGAARSQAFLRESTLFAQSVRSIVANSGGRLTRFKVERIPPSAENQSWASVYLLIGNARPR